MCRAVFEIDAFSLPINHCASSSVLAAAASPSSFSFSSSSLSHADLNNVVCEICERLHLKAKVSAHHRFISLDEFMADGGGGFVSRITRCEKHPHLEINTYCHTDKQAICAECVIDSHIGHKVERLTNVVQRFKQEISQLVDKVCFYSLSLLFFLFPPHPLTAGIEIIRSRSTMATCLRPSR